MTTMSDSAPDEEMTPVDPLTPFERWRWEVNCYASDATGRHPENFDKTDKGAAFKGTQERWFKDGMSAEEASERTIVMMARNGWLIDPVKFVCFPEMPLGLNGDPM